MWTENSSFEWRKGWIRTEKPLRGFHLAPVDWINTPRMKGYHPCLKDAAWQILATPLAYPSLSIWRWQLFTLAILVLDSSDWCTELAGGVSDLWFASVSTPVLHSSVVDFVTAVSSSFHGMHNLDLWLGLDSQLRSISCMKNKPIHPKPWGKMSEFFLLGNVSLFSTESNCHCRLL